MFKAIKDNKIVAINETEVKGGLVFDEQIEDTEHFIEDYVMVDGQYLLKEAVQIDYKNEQIRQQRQTRYVEEADPLRLDWDEASARNEPDADEKKQLWLEKKDQIRAELPYIEEDG